METYQRFFEFMLNEHGLTLVQSEMDDIIQEALLAARENNLHQLLKENEDDSIHILSFDPVDSITTAVL